MDCSKLQLSFVSSAVSNDFPIKGKDALLSMVYSWSSIEMVIGRERLHFVANHVVEDERTSLEPPGTSLSLFVTSPSFYSSVFCKLSCRVCTFFPLCEQNSSWCRACDSLGHETPLVEVLNKLLSLCFMSGRSQKIFTF